MGVKKQALSPDLHLRLPRIENNLLIIYRYRYMSEVERRYRFYVDDDIELDIIDIEDASPDDAAFVVALIEEYSGDRLACERLIDPRTEDEKIKEVKDFVELQNDGYNSYIVKLHEVHHWRLIFGVDHIQRIVGLLYIMKRVENYDEQVQNRVIAAYEKLGLKVLGKRL